MYGNSGNTPNKAPKWRGFAADPEIQAFVARQARAGQRSAPEIKRLLNEELGRSPSERTLQKMVKWAGDTDAEPWAIADAGRNDIALIAPVWAVALAAGSPLTKNEADWIVRVRLAAPDLPPDDAWGMASLYATEGRFATEGVRDALDALLAFAPWRSVDHAERYFGAANSGRIPSPRLAWNLAKRGFLKEDGRYMAAADSQAAAFFQNQPSFSITVEGESVTIEEKPPRRKAGRDE